MSSSSYEADLGRAAAANNEAESHQAMTVGEGGESSQQQINLALESHDTTSELPPPPRRNQHSLATSSFGPSITRPPYNPEEALRIRQQNPDAAHLGQLPHEYSLLINDSPLRTPAGHLICEIASIYHAHNPPRANVNNGGNNHSSNSSSNNTSGYQRPFFPFTISLSPRAFSYPLNAPPSARPAYRYQTMTRPATHSIRINRPPFPFHAYWRRNLAADPATTPLPAMTVAFGNHGARGPPMPCFELSDPTGDQTDYGFGPGVQVAQAFRDVWTGHESWYSNQAAAGDDEATFLCQAFFYQLMVAAAAAAPNYGE